mgnify:CR=1 FL=1
MTACRTAWQLPMLSCACPVSCALEHNYETTQPALSCAAPSLLPSACSPDSLPSWDLVGSGT